MQKFLLSLPMVTLLVMATPVISEQRTSVTDHEIEVTFVEDVGAAYRIRAADRLRTLSQEVSAATCFVFNDVLFEDHHAELAHSIDEFDTLLAALLNGDTAFNILGPETQPKTIQEINQIMAEWAPLRDAAEKLLDDPRNADAAYAIYDQSSHLLATTSHLLSELEEEYSHPTEVLMADVLLLEFAGRQAMITQKIAYETCLVWSGFGGQEQIDDLKKISTQFDLIARALHDGMPSIGIAAAPTDEIRIALEEVIANWDEVLEHLNHVTAGGEISVTEVEWIGAAMTEKMIRMERIVEMYADYSRRAVI